MPLPSRPTPAILLLGPSASGKSALAMALARDFPVEIISADSAQVYRGMDIGTAKPDGQARAAVPHHLIDIIDPTGAYSAARFCTDALALIRDIGARGRIPLLVGGTMLYFKALREGLSDLPQADAPTRGLIDAEAAELGWPALHAELARLDPVTAARLAPNDAQRIQRALEVFRLTGRPMSQLLARRSSGASGWRAILLGLAPADRQALHRRIEQRFDAMLESGLVGELRSLRSRFELAPTLPAMRCVGYRQAWQFLEGELDAGELRNRGIYATRQLAKRQLTWMRSMPGVRLFDCFAPGLADQARACIDEALHAR